MGKITIIAKNIIENASGSIRNDASQIINQTGGKFIQNAKAINYNDHQDRKPPTDIRITKLEGPFDGNDKLVDKIELGKTYSYKAIPTREPSITEVALLKWGVKLDDDKTEIVGGTAFNNKLNNGKITIALKISHDFDKAIVYAFYQKPTDDASVILSLKKFKFPMLILQGSRRKGKKAIRDANNIIKSTNETSLDMLYGDYTEDESGFYKLYKQLLLEEYNFRTKEEGDEHKIALVKAEYLAKFRIKEIKKFCKKDSSELFEIFKDKMWMYAIGDIKTVVRDMVDKVKSNSGGEYSNKILTDTALNHENSITFINGVKEVITEYLKENKGSIENLEIVDESNGKLFQPLKDKDIKSPIFDDNRSGLRIAVNDLWAYQIYITRYKVNGSHFEMGLEYIYYDHFGLDFPDIHKYDQDIFYVWFVLQHFRGYKPFITKLDIVGELKGTL